MDCGQRGPSQNSETGRGGVEKLSAIQSDPNYIKKHMVDIDTILTDEDEEALQQEEKA